MDDDELLRQLDEINKVVFDFMWRTGARSVVIEDLQMPGVTTLYYKATMSDMKEEHVTPIIERPEQ